MFLGTALEEFIFYAMILVRSDKLCCTPWIKNLIGLVDIWD